MIKASYVMCVAQANSAFYPSGVGK